MVDPTILILGGIGLLAMAKKPEPGLPVRVPGVVEGPQWELYRAAQVPSIGLKIPAPAAPSPPDLGDVLKATAAQVARAAAKKGIEIGVKKIAAPALAAGGKALIGKLGLGSIGGAGKLSVAPLLGPAAVIAIPVIGAVMAGAAYFESRKKKKKKRKAWRAQRLEYGYEMRAGGDVMAKQLLADYRADKGLLITRGEAREAFLAVYPQYSLEFGKIGLERARRIAKEEKKVLREAGFAVGFPRARGGMERPAKAYVVPKGLIKRPLGAAMGRAYQEAPAKRVTRTEALALARTGKMPAPMLGAYRRPAGGIR